MNKKASWTFKLPFIIVGIIFIASATIAIFYEDVETYQYDVGTPNAGMQAPDIYLESTDGTMFDLDDYQGETVLLYFQEGIMCQACWVQLRDIESNLQTFNDLGVDHIVTITTDPIGPLTQMANQNNFSTTILSDQNLNVSSEYTTNLYGMPDMGTQYNGHTFILVDGNSIIRWRADYGRYTMYVPIDIMIDKLIENLD